MNQAVLAEYIEQKRIAAKLDVDLKAARARADELERALLEEFANEGISSLKTKEGVTVYLRRDRRVSSPDMPQLCEAFKAAGLDAMVKETINNNTLRGWVNEQLDQGTEIPATIAPLITIYDDWSVNVRAK